MANTELATISPALEFTPEQVDLIKRTVAVGATNDELQLFMYVAKKTGLDPFTRHIYALKRWNKALGREVMAIQTGIDGYRVVADRTEKLAGISDPIFDDETKDHPNRASVTVKKVVSGAIAEFTATARWSEYVQTGKEGKPTGMWVKMPYLMLGKCAEALALRKAFPADLSGVYTTEEMAQADIVPQSEPSLALHPSDSKFVSTEEVNALWDKCKVAGKTKEQVQAELKSLGVRTVNSITPENYTLLMSWANPVGDAWEPEETQLVVEGASA